MAPREMAADEDKPNGERKKVWMKFIFFVLSAVDGCASSSSMSSSSSVGGLSRVGLESTSSCSVPAAECLCGVNFRLKIN